MILGPQRDLRSPTSHLLQACSLSPWNLSSGPSLIMEPQKDMSAELESFREQWRAEVKAKATHRNAGPSAPSSSSSRPLQNVTTGQPFTSSSKAVHATINDEEDFIQGISYDTAEAVPSSSSRSQGESGSGHAGEPVTALDHYEQAVEKESQGSLGESLRLYRKAFRVCLSR